MDERAALDELTARFEARLTGIGLVSLGRDEHPRIPGETAGELAKVAVKWAKERQLIT